MAAAPPPPAADPRGLAQQAFASFDLKRALALYAQAIELEPLDAELRSMRAACYCMLGAWPAAVGELEAAAELRPCAEAHARLAEGRLQLGDYGGARLALAAAQGSADAGDCAELPGLEAEIRQRGDAATERPATPQPQPEPELEPEPEPEAGPGPEPELSSLLCQPCEAVSVGEYLGSLCWAPDAVWLSPLSPVVPGAVVPLHGWEAALAARLPPDAASAAVAAPVLDGLSFPLSLAWALRKLAAAPGAGPEPFHIVVLGASALVEQRLLHADGQRPGGYWTELLQLCSAKQVHLHLVGPEVVAEEPVTVEVAAAAGAADSAGSSSLRVECHVSDALSFIEGHSSMFQRKPPSAVGEQVDGELEGWRCVAVAYHPGFGTGDPRLLQSWLPAVRQLVMLGVPTVCTCPNMIVDGAGEVAVLRQVFEARLIRLEPAADGDDAGEEGTGEPEGDVQAVANPFAGPSVHKEYDPSGLLDLSWRPNHLIYAFAGRVKGAGPLPDLDEHEDRNAEGWKAKTSCTGLLCSANHALMFAKMQRVAQQLR